MNIEELKFMDWKECKKTYIRKGEIDEERIKSLLKSSKKDLEKARKEDDESYCAERYYESIKKALTAFLLKNGLKSRNHQCLISYLYKRFPNKEYECRLILQMSYLRNRLSYYGENVPESFIEENKKDIEEIIKWILKLVGNDD